MKNIVYILCFIVFISACNKNDSTSNAFVSTDINISIVDSLGNNLLDTSNSNSINFIDIKHFYVDASDIVHEVYYPNLDYPRAIQLNPNGLTGYTLILFPYIDNNSLSISNSVIGKDIIKWNTTTVDTIVSEITKTNNTLKVTKVWYKNELVFIDNNGNNLIRNLTIIK